MGSNALVELPSPVEPEQPSGDEDAGRRQRLVVRVGTFYLVGPRERDKVELANAVADALEADERVIELKRPTFDPYWTAWQGVFPYIESVDYSTAGTTDRAAIVLAGRDRRPVLELSAPIRFTVRVPKKNQPTFHVRGEVAAEQYLVRWDGVSVVVGWREDEEKRIPRAGGQIVRKVIEEAIGACDCELQVQACSPTCRHLFVHTDIRVVEDPDAIDIELEDIGGQEIEARVPLGLSDDELMALVERECTVALSSFAQMKNVARRILDIEGFARDDVGRLARLRFARAHARHHPLTERLQVYWSIRHWRRDVQLILARLWLDVGTVEELRREWRDARFRFEEAGQVDDVSAVFKEDHLNEVLAVSDLDLRLTEASMADASVRLSNGAVVMATSAVALAAIVGVVVGHFL